MRIIVFFDLPVTTKKERKTATTFRRWLINNGYVMVQFSVYARICNGVDSVEKQQNLLKKYAPEKGSIRVLSVTEKQYADIRVLAGERNSFDKPVEEYQISFLI